MPFRSQHMQETERTTDDFLCLQGISLSGNLHNCKIELTIAVFLTIQPADIFQHLFCVQVTPCLYAYTNLPHISQAALDDDFFLHGQTIFMSVSTSLLVNPAPLSSQLVRVMRLRNMP